MELRPLPLVLPVLCQNVLLPLNQLCGRNNILRGIRKVGLFFCKFLLLVGDLPDGTPPVILVCFLPLQRRQLVPYADDLQEGIRFFLPGSLHEPRKVQGELVHKLVEELLAALLSCGIRYFQVAVFAFPFHHKAVAHDDM